MMCQGCSFWIACCSLKIKKCICDDIVESVTIKSILISWSFKENGFQNIYCSKGLSPSKLLIKKEGRRPRVTRINQCFEYGGNLPIKYSKIMHKFIQLRWTGAALNEQAISPLIVRTRLKIWWKVKSLLFVISYIPEFGEVF